MGTGYTRNDTSNNIADGNVINASDLDGEFDAIEAAFVETTGHTHDGTADEGAPVTVVGPVQDFVVSATEIKPKTTNTLDIGTTLLQFKDLYIDGTGYIDAVDIDGGNIDGTTIGGSSAAVGTFTTANATTVDTTNIEVTNIKAKDGTSAGSIADSTGVVTLASSVLTTADINGGNIDGTTIGASSAAAGTFTSLSATGGGSLTGTWSDLGTVTTIDINGGTIDGTTIGGSSAAAGTFTTANATTLDATNIEVTNIKAKDGTAAGSIADSTGVVTLASSVLTTTDINGGTVDGTTIGGSSAAAGTFTTFTSTGIDDNASSTALTISSADRVGIGTTSPDGNTYFHTKTTANTQAPLLAQATYATFTYRIARLKATRAANSGYQFLYCESDDGGDVEFNLRGDGTGLCDGSWTGGGADFAEYFEWVDGNSNDEDRRGLSVVLDGEKIRLATDDDNPSEIIGVISGNPTVVGDNAWNKWRGKYLRDQFGSYDLDENGHRQLNPNFDEDQEYVAREDRPEWSVVGLVGKLRVRKGQPIGDRWIKMRDINQDIEEYLVR